MTDKQAAKILTDLNKYRRGEPPYDWPFFKQSQSPKQIGIAIDVAIKKLKAK